MMSSYEVTVSGDESIYTREVEADKFEIEAGGVLVFYRGKSGNAATLGEMVDSNEFLALKEWDEVEQVEAGVEKFEGK